MNLSKASTLTQAFFLQATTPHVLIIAGSDSSGGAGIVRDIETANSLSCKSSVAITAITAQTNDRVIAVKAAAPDLLAQQIHAALSSNPIKAIKIGMVATAENANCLQKTLSNLNDIPIIYDPVLAASSGGALAKNNLIKAINELLLGGCDLLTPNISELAQLLSARPAVSDQEAIEQAKKLLQKGAKAILVKGGHLSGELAQDYLVTNQGVIPFSQPRLDAEMRGTGCTLSTSIACYLAKGDDLPLALAKAKDYLFSKLAIISKGEV